MRQAILRRCFAVLTAVFVLGAMAHAAEPQAYVVVVGVGSYEDPVIKPRPRAEDDAKAMYDLLTDKKHFAAADGHVKLLLSSKDEKRHSELATAENIKKALHWAFTSAKEDDLVLVYWAGQGGPLADRTCYFGKDTLLQDKKFKNVVGAPDIESEIEKSKSNRVCFILDVNFRGYDTGKNKLSETGLEKRFDEFSGRDDEEAETPPRPIVIVSANDGLSASIDMEKNGLFTTAILEALRGKADTEGSEADGHITVAELLTYIEKELPRRIREAGGKSQQPILARRGTTYSLTKNPAVSAEVAARLKKFEELVKGHSLSPEIARQGRELLDQMPRFENQRELRKTYQQLADGKITVEQFRKDLEVYLKSLKLPRRDAEAFADRIIKIAQITKEAYVKPVELHKLAGEAVKGLYRAINEKMPKEVADRIDNLKNEDENGIKKFLVEVRERLGVRDDLKGDKATDLALDRMLHSLDPYSTYIDPEQLADFKRATEQVFIGVGIQIQKDIVSDMVRVSTPLRGSPAYKGGILAGDLITKITNTVDKTGKRLPEPKTTSTKGMQINDVVKTILGKAGTPVTLTVERDMPDGSKKELSFELTRSRIQVETVLGVHRNADDSWDYVLDKANKIGYIRLTQFALNTERDLKAAIRELQKDGINGLVLDLRFNPGGYLDSAVGISDLFVDDGVIVSVRPREGRERVFRGQHAGSLREFPLVVLVNGGSASASEIVSACIQDHERGIVMGERSFGKGSVQNIMELDLGSGTSEVKLTTASFWRPSGKNLHRFPTSKQEEDWGVRPHPDFELKLTPTERIELQEHLRQNEIIPRRDPPKMDTKPTYVDKQLDMALEYLKKQLATSSAAKKAG